MNDNEGKAILRHWPTTTALFKLPSSRSFVKAFPPGPIVPFVVFGTASPQTQPDGAYVDVHPPSNSGAVPSADVLFIEICGSGLTNLRDKRRRYLPVHEARGLAFSEKWFNKPIKTSGAAGTKAAWQMMKLTSAPTQTLHALIRTLRVLYVVPDDLLASLAVAEVPRGHEFFVSDTWFRLTVSGWPGLKPAVGWAAYVNANPALTNKVKKANVMRFFDLNQHFLA